MTTTAEKIRQAEREGDLEALAVAARRAGISFAAHVRELQKQVGLAEQKLARIRKRRKAFALKRTLRAGQCTTCANRGYVLVHVHSDRALLDDGRRTCSTCSGSKPPVLSPVREGLLAAAQEMPEYCFGHAGYTDVQKAVELEAREIYSKPEKDARREVSAAKKHVAQFAAASAPTKGARVRLENGNARPKWTGTKERVEHGAEGTIFWTEVDYAGVLDRVGIVTDDGRKFFTASRNVSRIALNGWDRFLGVDEHTQQVAERKNVYEETAELHRGQDIEVDGKTLTVFWVGPCKKTGRQRFGAKKDRRSEPVWGYTDELAA